jgi:hypothetical protein
MQTDSAMIAASSRDGRRERARGDLGRRGNLPPLLAAAELLAARGIAVDVLASAATEHEARRRGLGPAAIGGRRSRT